MIQPPVTPKLAATALALLVLVAGRASAQEPPPGSIQQFTEMRRIYREVFVELATYRAERLMYYQTPTHPDGQAIDDEELARIKMLAEQIAREAYRAQ